MSIGPQVPAAPLSPLALAQQRRLQQNNVQSSALAGGALGAAGAGGAVGAGGVGGDVGITAAAQQQQQFAQYMAMAPYQTGIDPMWSFINADPTSLAGSSGQIGNFSGSALATMLNYYYPGSEPEFGGSEAEEGTGSGIEGDESDAGEGGDGGGE